MLCEAPDEIICDILRHLVGNPNYGSCESESGITSLGQVSLVCRRLFIIARRCHLENLHWYAIQQVTNNLSHWNDDQYLRDALGVPKFLHISVPMNGTIFEDDDTIKLYKQMNTRISTFLSLGKLVFANTTIGVQNTYPMLLSLGSLRSLSMLNVTLVFDDHIGIGNQNSISIETPNVARPNFPFTALQLIDLTLRGVVMLGLSPETSVYDPINFLRVPSLEAIDITWTVDVAQAYIMQVHTKTGSTRLSGRRGWPNVDIPCPTSVYSVLHNRQPPLPDSYYPNKTEGRLPLTYLTRLTVRIPALSQGELAGLFILLSDCPLHSTYDPPHVLQILCERASHLSNCPVECSNTSHPRRSEHLQNQLHVILLVDTLTMNERSDPISLALVSLRPTALEYGNAILGPISQYGGPFNEETEKILMGTRSPLSRRLVHDSNLIYGLTRMDSFHPYDQLYNRRTMREPKDPHFVISWLKSLARSTHNLEALSLLTQVLNTDFMHAITHLFAHSLRELVIRYAINDFLLAPDAAIMLCPLGAIIHSFPHLRSLVLIRIVHPFVEKRRAAFRREIQVWAEDPKNKEHIDLDNTDTRHARLHHIFDPLKSRPPPPGFEMNLMAYAGGWGRVSPTLREVQIDGFRFVRRFDGDPWIKASPIV